MAYGYDPSRYINDYSWLGEVGKVMANVAYKMPGLLELNKQIKENKALKEQTYESLNNGIDSLPDDYAIQIASGMGQATANAQQAKDFLKMKVPKPQGEKQDNGEYMRLIGEGFFAPLSQVASEAKLPVGQITARFSGNIATPALQTPQGQMAMQNDAQRKKEEQSQQSVGRVTQLITPYLHQIETFNGNDATMLNSYITGFTSQFYPKTDKDGKPKSENLLTMDEFNDAKQELITAMNVKVQSLGVARDNRQERRGIAQDEINKDEVEKTKVIAEDLRLNPAKPATTLLTYKPYADASIRITALNAQLKKLDEDYRYGGVINEKQYNELKRVTTDQIEWENILQKEFENQLAGTTPDQPVRQTQLDAAYKSAMNITEIKRNQKAVSDGTPWMNKMNVKYSTKPEKLNEEWLNHNKSGDFGYAFEVKKISDTGTGKPVYRIQPVSTLKTGRVSFSSTGTSTVSSVGGVSNIPATGLSLEDKKAAILKNPVIGSEQKMRRHIEFWMHNNPGADETTAINKLYDHLFTP
jgi:hypothetical protein